MSGVVSNRFPAALFNFFFLPASPLPLAILRICIGSLLLYQAAVLAPFVFELFGQNALVQGVLSQYLSNPNLPTIKSFFKLLAPLGVTESQAILAICIVYILSLIGMIAGYRTKLFIPLSWLLHLTLMNTAPCSNYGADQFLHIGLFYLMLSPCGDALSISSLQNPGRTSTAARFWLRLIQLHLCVAYLASGIEKSVGVQWWSGEVIWRALNLPVYAQFDMTWLAPHECVLRLAAWGTLIIEIGYPLFIWPRKTRMLWVFLVASLHIGIALLLGLGIFGLTMLSLTVCAFGLPAFFEESKVTGLSETGSLGPRAIVFFDGACAGCNLFVRWVLKKDSEKRILVAPLQGQSAASLLGDTDLNSIVLLAGVHRYEKSEAILRLLTILNWKTRFLGVFLLVPRGWRDCVYDYFAEKRYHWSRFSHQCGLLTTHESSRVLP